VELLDRAGEKEQELVDRRRVGGSRQRARRLDTCGRSGTAAAQTCRPAIRSVIACAYGDGHDLSFSLC
jgi:hypothetical protein